MIVSVIKGNLVSMMKESEKGLIGLGHAFYTHGCNCHNAMGSGIAPQIANAYPSVLRSDTLYHDSFPTEKSKRNHMLGTAFPVPITNNLTIINSYTQFYPGKDLRMSALRECFESLNRMIGSKGTLFIPMIGAGIAGGDWQLIKAVINNVTPDLQIVVVEYDGS